jgi:iron complex outermembrane receptor protein
LVANTIYTGSQYLNATNTREIPAWTRLDFGARYNTRIDGRPVTLRALVQNVLDTNYWSGVAASYSGLSWAPHAPCGCRFQRISEIDLTQEVQ